MIDLIKHIEYWKRGADSDLDTAELLINGKKYLEGLFFCHLTIEKILKALIVKNTGNIAPKSHNLNYLSDLAAIKLTDDQSLLWLY